MCLSVCLSCIDSETAGWIRTKLGGRGPWAPGMVFRPEGGVGVAVGHAHKQKPPFFGCHGHILARIELKFGVGVRSTILHKWAWPKATPTFHAHLQKSRLTARRAVKWPKFI